MLRYSKFKEGFTLIEIVIVISLIAVIYSVAMPQLNIRSGTEAITKLNQLANDIRNAYDLSLLSGKTYRMVFMLESGDYWLESSDKKRVLIGNEGVDHDPTAEEEKEAIELFDQKFEEYTKLAGEEVRDPVTDKMIKPTSPVLKAKNMLAPPVWKKVEDLEWSTRSIGPYLIFQDIITEHHTSKQSFDSLGVEENARVFLFFFPDGYVEKAFIHVAYKKGDSEIDESKEPFTLKTNPSEGTVEIISGYKEGDI